MLLLSAPYILFALNQQFAEKSLFTSGIFKFLKRVQEVWSGITENKIQQILSFFFVIIKNEIYIIAAAILSVFAIKKADPKIKIIYCGLLGAIVPAIGFFFGEAFIRYIVPFIICLILYSGLSESCKKNELSRKIKILLISVYSATIVLLIFRLNINYFNSREIVAAVFIYIFIFLIIWRDKSLAESKSLILVALTWPVITFGNYNKISELRNVEMSISDARRILGFIHDKTNWSRDQFRQRTIIEQLHSELDLDYLYGELVENSDKYSYSESELSALIVNFPSRYHNINCLFTLEIPNFKVCLYKSDNFNSLNRIGNVSNQYFQKPPFFYAVTQASGVIENSKSEAIFYFNQCAPDFNLHCVIYFKINFIDEHKFLISILGSPVGASHPFINPTWSIHLESPKISLSCGKKDHEFEIVRSIGFEDRLRTVLAPYAIVMNLPCASPHKVSLTIENFTSVYKEFKAQNLSWKR